MHHKGRGDNIMAGKIRYLLERNGHYWTRIDPLLQPYPPVPFQVLADDPNPLMRIGGFLNGGSLRRAPLQGTWRLTESPQPLIRIFQRIVLGF